MSRLRDLSTRTFLSVGEIAGYMGFGYEAVDRLFNDDPINVPLAIGSLMIGTAFTGARDQHVENVAAERERERIQQLNPDVNLEPNTEQITPN